MILRVEHTPSEKGGCDAEQDHDAGDRGRPGGAVGAFQGGWGAAHVGVTRVGPGGVYHSGRTVAAGPRGVYAGGRTGAVGAYGGSYRAGYGGAVGYGGAAGYRYRAGYAGGVGYAGAARYGYIR